MTKVFVPYVDAYDCDTAAARWNYSEFSRHLLDLAYDWGDASVGSQVRILGHPINLADYNVDAGFEHMLLWAVGRFEDYIYGVVCEPVTEALFQVKLTYDDDWNVT